MKIIIDLDGTIAQPKQGQGYADCDYDKELVNLLRFYRAQGFTIAIHTSRNMRSFSGNIGRINAVTLPQIVTWLKENDVPYDEIHVGKPWCGEHGFYVDDKAIRPDEFKRLSLKEVYQLIGCQQPADL